MDMDVWMQKIGTNNVVTYIMCKIVKGFYMETLFYQLLA